jgi:prepilin-type N-terminal cleavage/methylation domain-containing protein/prepilin-type processing-associated H-X9-DG protein
VKSLLFRRRRRPAFTLVELLVVIAIIGLMLGLAMPAFSSAILKAQSVKCGVNLRSIGVAVSLAASDNNNTYPEINQVANSAPPVYPSTVPGLVGVLGPYGISTNSVQCPTDLQLGAAASCNQMAYPNPGSSYEWRPAFDDESVNATLVYINSTTPIPINSSRVRLCDDFNALHRGHANAVYGDGHVSVH